MKLLTSLFFIVILSSFIHAQNNNFSNLWKEVEAFEIKGLPKSALKIVTQIETLANKEQNDSQQIKVLLYKSKFALLLEEEAQLKIINAFKTEINKASFPKKNILESYLANLFWQYYQQNRWKIYNRTKTETKVDKTDFRTWDLQTLFNEITLHFKNSLDNTLALQQTSTSVFNEILMEQPESKKYRPTLYDLLAHNALDFYASTESNITKPAYKFTIDNPDFIAPANKFTNIYITTKDSTSLQVLALKTYQNLIRFHSQNQSQYPLTQVNLERLLFVKNHAVFNDVETHLIQTLKKEIEAIKTHETSVLYTYELASIYNNQAQKYNPKKEETYVYRWKNKDALNLCNKTIETFPESNLTNACKQLIQNIKNPRISLKIEKYIPVNYPALISVNYKNLDSLYFSALAISNRQLRKFTTLYEPKKIAAFIKKLPAAKSWETALKNEGDYQDHTTEVVLPPLKNGTYLIIASEKKEINNNTIIFGNAPIQVTDFALTNFQDETTNSYQVINRITGKPIIGAQVTMQYKERYNGPTISKYFTTDAKGYFIVPKENLYLNDIRFSIEKDSQKGYFGNYSHGKRYTNNENAEDTKIKSFTFTDRSIYRPGQTVFFKTIVLQSIKYKSQVIPNGSIYATLYDVNEQEVGELELKTNAFGSASGEFILPNNGLTGQFYIEIDSDEIDFDTYDETYFSVEEYKRPTFEATFKPVTKAFKVNDSVTVTGESIAFNGSAIGNAKVTYRVRRNVQYPRWYYWYRPWYNSTPQEITHGETKTNDSGEFSVTFKAIPDALSDKKNLPIFTYEIIADITDINGETRSTTTNVRVGYHTLVATLQVAEKINKTKKNNSIQIDTRNLNGEFLPAKGTLTIYKLLLPNQVLRERPWNAPDYPLLSKETFKKMFPHIAYANESDFTQWKKGDVVFSETFDTKKSKEIVLKNCKKWKSGRYLIKLETEDAFGQEVTDQAHVLLFSPKDNTVPDKQIFTLTLDKQSYKINDKVAITLGTAAENLAVTLLIEKNNRIISTKVFHLNNNKKTVFIPVTAEDYGGFAIHYSFAFSNSFTENTLTINVPYPEKDLQIEANTFRDKLKPGQEETWSFTVKGPTGEKVAAELLASMYDASLDQFKLHKWRFTPTQRSFYDSRASIYSNTFDQGNFSLHYPTKKRIETTGLNFDQLNWFGLYFNFNQNLYNRYLFSLKEKINSSYDSTIKQNQIKGIVTDTGNVPLLGVSVTNKTTNKKAKTDFDGIFLLEAKEGDVILLSYVGFRTKEFTVSKNNIYNITLLESTEGLENVIVTANGIKRKNRTLRDSVSYLSEEEASLDEVVVTGIAKNVEKDASQATSLDNVVVRKNLQETAFFYPHLRTDASGNCTFSFTTPEALTRWKLQLLAHTKSLESTVAQFTTVTQKELMVTPNLPRFFREGDTTIIASKVSNISEKNLTGQAQITFYDAITNKDITQELVLGANYKGYKPQENKLDFTLPAKQNTNVSWKIFIPEKYAAIVCKIVAKAGDFSDGEQRALPVLTNRMLVTETLPMWIRSNQTKTFTLDKLKDNTSTTLKNHKLTLEVTSNPAWYAVQALPYLMEYPYECNEQTFARYYANALASHIATSNPRIQEVFNQWKNSDALLSNLEKNQELKSLLIQETPWLRDAQSETEQKKRIALLFDLNKMKNQLQATNQKLVQNQLSNGAWSWFKGGRENRYITQHIITGFGHLKKLGVTTANNLQKRALKKAITFLDQAFVQEYNDIKRYNPKADYTQDHLSYSQIHYLYMRSFFPEIKMSKEVSKITTYYLNQIQKYWLKRPLYAKGMMTLISYRANRLETTKEILNSLKETSITSEELGMYWKENTSSWHWYQAPIETQALLIEAFSEAGTTIQNQTENVSDLDNLKIWLLKNKQTNRWKTTKATTEAVYALLLQGSDWLSVTDMVAIEIGGKKIDPSKLEETKVEAGTGYFKTSWNTTEIKPEMASVTLTKKSEGIAWGAMYWQYFEDLDKITPAETPLQLSKKLFLKKNTDTGESLFEITNTNPLKLGDLVRVRIELKVDRPMEFVHLKDMRAAGFEPINVISSYKWQDGLGYYESTKDAATNFFFDYLPKGVYVFQYDLRVNNEGDFSNGISTIQSMYAPEFSSHSEGIRITVK